MFIFLIVLISIIGLLLTLAVLLQSGSGGGLAGIASGGATTQILGSRQAPDFLEKATWVLATAFIILCILTTFAIGPSDQNESVIQQRAQDFPTEQQSPILPPPGATDATTAPDGATTAPAGDAGQGTTDPGSGGNN
jgi:preprotein translocase subunit SecG